MDNVSIKPIPILPNAKVEDSAKNPITGYITTARVTIAAKFSIVCLLGLRTGSIKPEWRPDDSLAPKILTKPPLSPENNGTNVSNVWFLSNVVRESFNIPPANVPRREQMNNTGVDCLTMCLTSLFAVYPEIKAAAVTTIASVNTIIFTIGIIEMYPTMITLKIIAGSVKKSPTAAINGVVILSGSQPPSKLLSEINIVIGSIMIVDTKPAMNEIKTKSKMLMLSNPKSMQTPFAITASKIDNTIVKISEAVMFSLKISDLLNSGDNVPIWRWVLSLEPKDPKMFPLIPIAPGMITISPG